MRNLFILTKVQFLSFFKLNKILKNKGGKKALSLSGTALVLLLLAGLIFGAGYLYSGIFAKLYILTGEIYKLIPLMLAISVVASFILSFYSAGSLYDFKDYELLCSMPIKTHEIVLSRIIFSYIADFSFTLLLVAPSVIVYSKFAPFALMDGVRLFVMTLFTPFFAICLSLLIGLIVSFISSFFNKKSMVQTVVMLAIFVAFFVYSYSLGMDENPFAVLEYVYVFFPWIINGILEWKYVLLFSGVSTVTFFAFVLAVSLTYKKINTMLTGRRTKSNFKLKGDYRGKSAFNALYRKEIKTLFSYSIYAMNSLIGVVMTVGMSLLISIAIGSLQAEGISELLVFAPLIFTVCLLMSPTTYCSISMESQSFWIIKTAPVPAKTLFNAKLAVNMTFAIPSALISSLALCIGFKAQAIVYLLLVAIALLLAVLGSYSGLIFNLLFPVMKWESPNKVVKQSTSIIMCMLESFVLAGGLFAFIYFVNVGMVVKLACILGLLIVLTVLAYLIVDKKGERLLINKT